MDGEGIYNHILKMTIGERRKYFQTITPEQKIEYQRYNQKMRQAKFYSNAENKAYWNMYRRDYKAGMRKQDPSIYREANRIDVHNFREREKAKEQALKEKQAISVVENDIKINETIRKDLKEEALKEREAKKAIKEKKLEAKRAYMREYRAKKKAV
jgi:hypothetical protein